MKQRDMEAYSMDTLLTTLKETFRRDAHVAPLPAQAISWRLAASTLLLATMLALKTVIPM